MRRKELSNDSLDLLLDAMCNSFGGVMFIAMAVVVISSKLPKEFSDEEQRQQYEEKVATLEHKVQEADKDLAALTMAVSQREEFLNREEFQENSKEINDFLNLQEDQKRLDMKNRILKAECSTMAAREAETSEALEEERLKHKRLSQLLADAQSVSDEQKADLAEATGELVEPLEPAEALNLDFPRISSSYKKPYWLIVDGGCLYRINSPGKILYPGPECNHSSDVKTEWNAAYKRQRFIPIPGRGLDLKNCSQKEIRSFFGPISRDRFFANILVRVDSFEYWMSLRNFLRKTNYNYFWTPLIKHEPVDLFSAEEVNYESY